MIETSNIAANGWTFRADLAGPSGGEPVLLLHGFPQSRHAWRMQLPALAAAGYRAVAPDQRGYAPGARPTDADAYVTANIVADALAMMDTLGAERFHLIGHDWGGQIAWLLAARSPERVRSLAVLSRPHPAAFARSFTADAEQANRSRHHSTLLEPGAADAMLATGLSAFRTMFERQGVPAQAADAYIATLSDPGALEAAIHWYRQAGGLRAADTPPIAAPTLYLWGDADATIGRAAAAGTGDFVTGPYRFEVVPGAGHFLTDQVPDVVTEALLRHLASVRSERA
jgi:pimeloyl-ACP methyl ester carboxylesterase